MCIQMFLYMCMFKTRSKQPSAVWRDLVKAGGGGGGERGGGGKMAIKNL